MRGELFDTPSASATRDQSYALGLVRVRAGGDLTWRGQVHPARPPARRDDDHAARERGLRRRPDLLQYQRRRPHALPGRRRRAGVRLQVEAPQRSSPAGRVSRKAPAPRPACRSSTSCAPAGSRSGSSVTSTSPMSAGRFDGLTGSAGFGGAGHLEALRAAPAGGRVQLRAGVRGARHRNLRRLLGEPARRLAAAIDGPLLRPELRRPPRGRGELDRRRDRRSEPTVGRFSSATSAGASSSGAPCRAATYGRRGQSASAVIADAGYRWLGRRRRAVAAPGLGARLRRRGLGRQRATSSTSCRPTTSSTVPSTTRPSPTSAISTSKAAGRR